MIEHPITTQRALTEAARLEPSTAAVRALNYAMASVCDGLLARGLQAVAQSHRPEPEQQIQALRERQDS